MVVDPIVRHMLLCENWRQEREHSITIISLINYIQTAGESAYPFTYRELCVVLLLAGGRGEGEGKVVCVLEEQDHEVRIFRTDNRKISFGYDPLAIHCVSFRIRQCRFPRPGLYSLQFWFEGRLLHAYPLCLR